MGQAMNTVNSAIYHLNKLGGFLPQLGLRILLAWEFWESGYTKFTGDNYFAELQASFPFPLNLLPVDVNWFMATWVELLGALALFAGLGTRFFAFSLFVVNMIAWISVHAGNGYNVCDNGYKMALFYAILLLPLIFTGPGKLSLDYLIAKKWGRNHA
jgi:putative oxidoreductase